MASHLGTCASLGIVALLNISVCAQAQEPVSVTEPKPAQALDRATVLIRREVQAISAERERVFARLRELAPAPGVAARVQPEIVLQRLDDAKAMEAIRFLAIQRIRMVEADGDENDDDDDNQADANAPRRARFIIARESFDRRLFGGLGVHDSSLAFVEALQSQRIEAIVRQHRLGPDQKEKLVLAARGDVKRLSDRIDDARRQFELLRTDFDRCRRFLQTLQPLQNALRQDLALDAESLVAKTLKRILQEGDGGRARVSK
jgi:hypothetical protein